MIHSSETTARSLDYSVGVVSRDDDPEPEADASSSSPGHSLRAIPCVRRTKSVVGTCRWSRLTQSRYAIGALIALTVLIGWFLFGRATVLRPPTNSLLSASEIITGGRIVSSLAAGGAGGAVAGGGAAPLARPPPPSDGSRAGQPIELPVVKPRVI